MEWSMRVIISTGGTGGHLYPAIALADELKSLRSDIDIFFFTGKSPLERELMLKSGYPVRNLSVHGFRRKVSLDFLRTSIRASEDFLKASQFMRVFLPDIVIGCGGAVSAPVVMAARYHKIPTLIHEQNVVPGLTNRLLSKFASVIAISFIDSRAYFPNRKKTELTGNPIRQGVLDVSREEAFSAFDFDGRRKTLTVFGGSQGARTINEAVISCYHLIRDKDIQVLHITGEGDYSYVSQRMSSVKKSTDRLVYKARSYLDRMGLAYAASDLVLARAGATTVAELSAWGCPALLVPYPYAPRAHQERNAQVLKSAGAAEIIPNRELSGENLASAINQCLFNDEILARMGQNMKNLAKPKAARRLAELVLETAKSE
jgi:UDP-N-acetylglucosamine--N-acetylmuramyl-(pentapeptide) pyrophosphoryl-undecaprenol N-acetylglucosamine transferase